MRRRHASGASVWRDARGSRGRARTRSRMVARAAQGIRRGRRCRVQRFAARASVHAPLGAVTTRGRVPYAVQGRIARTSASRRPFAHGRETAGAATRIARVRGDRGGKWQQAARRVVYVVGSQRATVQRERRAGESRVRAKHAVFTLCAACQDVVHRTVQPPGDAKDTPWCRNAGGPRQQHARAWHGRNGAPGAVRVQRSDVMRRTEAHCRADRRGVCGKGHGRGRRHARAQSVAQGVRVCRSCGRGRIAGARGRF